MVSGPVTCQDPCDPNPCQNGGSCLDGACTCATGFLGENCETKDPCEPNPCQNGGSCTDGACTCADGFSGENCETEDPVEVLTEACYDLDTDYYGSDIGAEFDVASAKECQNICAGNPDCKFFTYITTKSDRTDIHNKCHLKSDSTGETEAIGMISGPSECCFDYDTDYFGSDIAAELDVDSAEDCQNICADNPDCKYFTYITAESDRTDIHNKCHLKSDAAGETEAVGMVSGPVTCQEDVAFCVEQTKIIGWNTRFASGNNYETAATKEECLSLCYQYPTCQSIEYNQGYEKCQMNTRQINSDDPRGEHSRWMYCHSNEE